MKRLGRAGRNIWKETRWTFLVLALTQIGFSGCDLLARLNLRDQGFSLHSLAQPWFLLYLGIWQSTTFGQLLVFSRVHLGKTMAMFSAAAIVTGNLLGLLLLGEALSWLAYLGSGLAVLAVIVMALR
jgi:drug/metabolite transporter (DMT)-like permease